MDLYKMQISGEGHQHEQEPLLIHSLQLGLKDLTLAPVRCAQSPLSSPMLSDILLSPAPSSPGLMSGDYIGMESCVDVIRDDDTALQRHDYDDKESRRRGYEEKLRGKQEEKRAAMMKRRDLPPPIPSLARTENLPSHMPWVLKRHYTPDGRLILTEEKVRHHEYFRAHRSNGRLTLQLVPLDDDVSPPPFAAAANQNHNDVDDGSDDEEYEFNDYDDDDDDQEGFYDDDEEEEEEEEEEEAEDGDLGVVDDDGPISNSSSGKCFNFNSVGAGSPCIFGVPVPAIRQVHS